MTHRVDETVSFELRTREENGPKLLETTKIGGPSHGLDIGAHCLLGLLADGRTNVIEVDDSRWPHNAAARAYMRLLPLEDGTPSIYLEHVQRDFPHRSRFGHGPLDGHNENRELEKAVLRHAIMKADAVSKANGRAVPLTVPWEYEGALKAIGAPYKAGEHKFVIEPSAGLVMASDTLVPELHDFVNIERRITPQRYRFVVGASTPGSN